MSYLFLVACLQGPRAEAMMKQAMDRGHWVFFQNCHLAPSWMPSLERLVEQIDGDKVSCPILIASHHNKHLYLPLYTFFYFICWSVHAVCVCLHVCVCMRFQVCVYMYVCVCVCVCVFTQCIYPLQM